MKHFKKNQKIYFIISLFLLIISFILLRINNNYTKLIGLILFPIIVILIALMLREDKSDKRV